MEPDLDKLASTKIRQAELRPTRWNKETVWQNVMSETSQIRRKYYFHHSSAAAILLVLFLGIQHVQNEVEPQFTEVNKKSQQQNSEPQTKSVAPGTTQTNIAHQIDKPAVNIEAEPVMEIQKHDSGTTSVEREEQDVKPIVEPIIADLEITEGEFFLREDKTIHEQKIRPIVGVITESYAVDVAKVKRKKSLHKLESLEPVPWEGVSNAIVFARKK